MKPHSPLLKCLLKAQQAIDWVTVEKKDLNGIDVSIQIEKPDGTYDSFAIRVTTNEKGLVAFKQPYEAKLPIGCYDRHIMANGSFCLGWEGDGEFTDKPQNLEECQKWWQWLAGFLKLQQEANLSKRWRTNCGWKHSSEMASKQQEIENLESTLSSDNAEDLGKRHEIERLRNSLDKEQKRWLEKRVLDGVTCCGSLKHCELRVVYNLVFERSVFGGAD